MAERKRSTTAEAQQLHSLFEVTTRNPLGRETVHRHRADSADNAVDLVVADPGIERDQVVEVRQVSPG